MAITLRIVLIENLRRLSDQITLGRAARADADALADRLLATGGARSALDTDIAARSSGPLSELFAAQLAKRLRDQDPRTTPTLGWLEERLGRQGVSIDDVVRHAQQRQGASNVTVRNVITSMRLISDVDWAELFESVSLVDARLRAASAFAAMDFPTRNLYRSAIEQAIEAASPALRRLAGKAGRIAHDLIPAADDDGSSELAFWIEALSKSVVEHGRDRLSAQAPDGLNRRLKALADTARALALAMDFAFLVDPDRKLLSIGYSVPDQHLDPGCYDLLASEARLASLFAVAKGDVPTRHWFRLGRAATPLGSGSVLISWSGSMFEYLMPALIMRAPAGSLLEQTSRLVVARQQAYARSLGVPWGISEAAYNARDAEFTYQYSNFGVPGLGLKRGLADNVVIAPYATGLATMVDPHGARTNFARLNAMGALSRYGFFEALDFTPSRLPAGEHVAIVRTVMAHHQGMTIVALAPWRRRYAVFWRRPEMPRSRTFCPTAATP